MKEIMAKNSKFNKKIKLAQIEREVEDVYNEGIALYFDNATITHPFSCDGLVDTKVEGKLCKLIMEYKYDKELKNTISRASVIAQVLFYLKKFEEGGLILPNICLVGDINECFVFHTNDIQKYLSYDIDWTTAPSNAHIDNPELVTEIANDEIVNPFIFDVNENFSFKDVADKIKDLAVNVQRLVNVTEHNIAIIYEYFCNNVIRNEKSISPNDLVSIFINAITDHDTCYIHPKKKNTLVCNNIEVEINTNAYDSFFSYFNKNYTPKEKSDFSKISDRLIEDTNRRNKGEFYTPTSFVDHAHRMFEKKLGDDWKKNYVVWDNCCGTKNLVRDYSFECLYCSTLEQGELDQCSDYNKNATSFQFDFLNDSLDKLPQSLLDALKANKPFVFFINPPYATSASGNGKKGKKNVSNTYVYTEMMKNNIGGCSQNLYAQFLYRIMMIKKEFNLTNVHIGLYSPTLFLTGSSWKKFRNSFLNEFAFDNAVQFKASHFADCADTWGISFSIWHNGVTENKTDFEYTLIDKDKQTNEIIETGKKIVYNIDGKQSASDWLREPNKNRKDKLIYPHFSSAIKVSEKENQKLLTDAIGSIMALSNSVYENAQGVGLSSAIQTKGSACISISVTKDNFDRCTTLFSARKLIVGNWINSKDEYLAPNTDNKNWNEFVNDSLIYSLFHTSSNQSSLRNVEYKDKLWDIKNEFFFMSKDEIKELANQCKNDECYNDITNDTTERFVYNKLQSVTLSKEAQKVLDLAKKLVVDTFKYRTLFNAENKAYQINNWDCGWYQIKAVAKKYAKKELDEFDTAFKALANKMRPMVYELGFLK